MNAAVVTGEDCKLDEVTCRELAQSFDIIRDIRAVHGGAEEGLCVLLTSDVM